MHDRHAQRLVIKLYNGEPSRLWKVKQGNGLVGQCGIYTEHLLEVAHNGSGVAWWPVDDEEADMGMSKKASWNTRSRRAKSVHAEDDAGFLQKSRDGCQCGMRIQLQLEWRRFSRDAALAQKVFLTPQHMANPLDKSAAVVADHVVAMVVIGVYSVSGLPCQQGFFWCTANSGPNPEQTSGQVEAERKETVEATFDAAFYFQLSTLTGADAQIAIYHEAVCGSRKVRRRLGVTSYAMADLVSTQSLHAHCTLPLHTDEEQSSSQRPKVKFVVKLWMLLPADMS